MSINDIEPGPKVPDVLNVVIEIPKGSQNKYEFDKESNMIKLDRVLYSPFFYFADYGFVPRTLCEDGDPLDVFVLVSNPLPPGCLVEVRPIGLLKMIDGGEEDFKILGVAKDDPRYDHITDIKDVSPHMLIEIKHFFERYKDLQGKETEVGDWEDAAAAKEEVKRSVELYKNGGK